MGEFKTMTKMMTDEDTIFTKSYGNAKTTKLAEAKDAPGYQYFKKGGAVMKKADGGFASTKMVTAKEDPGYEAYKKGGKVKKADGGAMGTLSDLAAIKLAGKRAAKKPMGARPSMPASAPASMPPASTGMPGMKKGGMMKEGGKADMGQDKAMIKKAFKQHDMQEHKGGKGTDLKLKKGGASKKAYATGGAVEMAEGKKKPTPPVAINMLSGTFKKGGMVSK